MARILVLAVALPAAALAISACGGDGNAGPGSSSDPGERGTGSGARAGQADEQPLAGAGRLVFVGDSLSVTGGDPSYPERLAASIEGIEIENLGRAGTTSADWRPDGELFSAELLPRLADADAVVVSVGGNDLERAVGGGDGPDALGRAGGPGGPTRIVEAMDRIERNLRRIFRGIRRQSPGVRLAFVGYPDYSRSSAWEQRAGSLELAGLRIGLGELQTRARLAGADLVVDMLGPTGRGDVDRLLSGGEYLSDAGHRLYARRLGRLLEPSG